MRTVVKVESSNSGGSGLKTGQRSKWDGGREVRLSEEIVAESSVDLQSSLRWEGWT